MTETEYRDLYPALCRALRCQFPRADDDAIHDAVTDALVDHWRRPWRHDPARLSLVRYLRMAAVRNLLNALRRVRCTVSCDRVISPSPAPDTSVLSRLAADDLVAWLLAQARDEAERQVIARLIAGDPAGAARQTDADLARARDRLTRRSRRRSGPAAGPARSRRGRIPAPRTPLSPCCHRAVIA